MAFFLAWIAVLLFACRVQAAAVFAHFMVTNSANYTSDDWENDMKLAQDAHIDAFALNMAYDDPNNVDALPAAFSAADSVGFKLFFSFDYAGNGDWPRSDVINLITEYSAHSSYFFYNGQAFVSTFEGPDRAQDWPIIKSETGCFFVPSWSSLGAKPAVETGVVDGLFSWAGWPWGAQDMDTYTDASYLQYLVSLPYMMPVSPWFFTNLPGYKKNWIWRGDHLWHDRWQEVLFIQPEFVEIISWNDYGESHYIGPLHDNAMEAFEIGEAPFNYVTDMPHDAWRLTLPFWIDMYKENTAEVTEESILTWYRVTPGAACGSGGTSGNTASQLQIEFPPDKMAQDSIFFSAVLGSFSSAVVSIGGEAQTVGWSYVPDDDIGVYHGSVEFDGRTGPVVVSLMRDNVIIATIEGKEISATCENGIQNWNAWAGSATAGIVSSRSTLSLSQQTCQKGTGAKNFAGICGFACKYGYCPLGACTCTKMGFHYEPPNSTGVIGYPIAGEDASYSGLCSFDCNLGYCPSEACGTVDVPLTVPTVSPFLPPACTAGTGEGNLGGLCDFSCAHGFCPMNACTCTGEGALNVLDPTTNVTGVAGATQDPTIYGPLCEYTCARGYCPEGACTTSSDTSSGSSSGSGSGSANVYISPSIWDDPSPVLQCEPPCSLILPPLQLAAPSHFSIPPWSTSVYQSSLTTRTSTAADGSTKLYHGYNVTVVDVTLTFPEIVMNEIPVWGISINASQTGSSSVTLTKSIDLPQMIYVLPPTGTGTAGGASQTSVTTTITPPPWPWSVTGTDTDLNTTPTSWSSAPPKETVSKGSKGAGHRCVSFCRGPCLTCLPSIDIDIDGGISSGSGGGSDGSSDDDDDDDDCSTETAEICSTACVGSDCDFECSTTTGCSVTPSSTTMVGTPAPAIAVTWQTIPASVTIDSDYDSSIAVSLESVYSSLFGPLSIIAGPGAAAATPIPTGAVPEGSGYPTSDPPWSVVIYYWQDEHSGDGQWELYQIEGGMGGGGCPEVATPNQIITDGSYEGLGDGYSGFKAFGSSCTYNGKNLPTGDLGAEVGTLSCDGYRDAICYTGDGDEGSCSEPYQSVFNIVSCVWYEGA